jgi:hypothetical protein
LRIFPKSFIFIYLFSLYNVVALYALILQILLLHFLPLFDLF